MLTLFRRFAAALPLFLALPALAQPATRDADPALWVVKDDDTTIYLFGTVHILKPGLSWFDEAVRKAFDASGELVTEIGGTPDPAAVQPALIKYGVNMSGPSLSEKLPADKRAAFAKAVSDAGLQLALVDRFDPWLAAVQLSMLKFQRLGYDPREGVEEGLNAAAKTANKPVSGLETIEQQFGFFDSIPEAAQIAFLISTIDRLEESGPMFDKMIREWAQGDAKGLAKLMNKGMEDTPDVSRVLLAERNARWAEWVAKRLDKPGVVFVAVGAGHLAGKDSVQELLMAKRIRAKRVRY